MKLYIGGEGSAQELLAKSENPAAEIIYDFQLLTKKLLEEGKSPQDYASQLCQDKPDAVIVCNEIGLGIHPFEKSDRTWREETGRALGIIAKNSKSVTRVICGIGQRIK